MINKKISTIAGSLIILVIAIILGFSFIISNKKEEIQNQNGVVLNNADLEDKGKVTQEEEILDKETSLNWNEIKFDICDNGRKYENMLWWNNFTKEVEKYNYYSDSYIKSTIESINNNIYVNPEKFNYTYESYCDDEKNKNISICVNKNKKLAINDFNLHGEGCLSKDESIFVAVFPGVYSGAGNYVFRYDINNTVLKEAQILDSNILNYQSILTNPPKSFDKITKNKAIMSGKTGDAGCSLESEFEYDIEKNQIKIIKQCSQCIGESLNCKKS